MLVQALPMRRICVATDGSDHAQAALKWAVERFMNRSADELYVVSVTVPQHAIAMVWPS